VRTHPAMCRTPARVEPRSDAQKARAEPAARPQHRSMATLPAQDPPARPSRLPRLRNAAATAASPPHRRRKAHDPRPRELPHRVRALPLRKAEERAARRGPATTGIREMRGDFLTSTASDSVPATRERNEKKVGPQNEKEGAAPWWSGNVRSATASLSSRVGGLGSGAESVCRRRWCRLLLLRLLGGS
jgi:hypothetical protein